MSLALLVGPANAGKVANLLDRYVAALDRDPCLVVPNRGEVERVERDLLTRVPALLGGWLGTFDGLSARIARRSASETLLTPLQRSLVVRRVAAQASLEELGASARFAGFGDALGDALAELESALVEPEEVDGELGRLYRAYRAELERLGAVDRELLAGRAAAAVGGDFAAWSGAPVFVYGFEDLTGAQWALLEALAGRCEVVVSLPYEPGRPAFAALERIANDLARLSHGPPDELPAQNWYDSPALAHLERVLFEDREVEPPPLEGAVRFLEAAGRRGVLELVGEEVLGLLRDGVDAADIGIVVPSVDHMRAPLETAFGALGVPYAVEGARRLVRTPFGRALLALLRFAWLGGGRSDLYAFLRSPYSGLPRSQVDFAEGRLRGRAVSVPERVEEETVRLLGRPIAPLERLGSSPPLEAVGIVCRSMLQSAWGLERPPVDGRAEVDLQAEEAVRGVVRELAAWDALGGSAGPDEVVAALERATTYARAREPGRVVVIDLLRARTRRFGYVFVLGLEEGVLPRRSAEAPFVSDEVRAGLETRAGRRLVRPDQIARDRYLFYTACTRAWRRLSLVREAATEEGRPREASPFYDEVRSRFAEAEVARWTQRRPLSALSWELHAAPTERERLRSVAVLASEQELAARSLAASAGWSRQLDRALAAFSRATRLVNPRVLEQIREQTRFSVTELETFGDCSAMWLVDRVVNPRPIDAEVDPRLRGQVAHQALYRFYAGLPKRFGTDDVDPARLEEAIAFLHECLAEALAGQVRIELGELDLLELEGTLGRDLEHFVRQDTARGLPLVPRRFEVSFGTERAAPELQRGIDLDGFTVSGKIDRIDVDPFSARGIVQDYKSGAAHSARRIEQDGRLQVPLYVLALRDLVGIEPLGGLYRSLSGEREARGLLRLEAQSDVPGFASLDYLDEDAFWGVVTQAKERARDSVARIRGGDVHHDPRSGRCPTWCDRWTICRVARA